MMLTNKFSSLFFIILLYLIANIFMLLNNGWYWDDWCISSYAGLKDICQGVGIPYMIPVHSFLLNLTATPALLYHILTGFFEILAIIIFFKCLLLFHASQSQAFILSTLFGLMPYNMAKTTMACFMYTTGFLFFLVAVLAFIYFIRRNNIILRIISLSFFFCSFALLPSLLVLTLAFLLYIAVFNETRKIEFNWNYFKLILTKLLSWADFLLIPFIFWILRSVFLKPSGIYVAEGYRELSISSVLLTPIHLIDVFIKNFIGIGTITDTLNISSIYTILFALLFIILFILFRQFKIEQFQNGKMLVFTGLYFFFAGAFPYTMVGKFPLFDGYDSRHQILLRLGSAFLLFYIISLSKSQTIQKLGFIVLVSLFIISTISHQLQYQKSWFKQLALEKVFSQEKLLTEGTNFVVIDNTMEYNEHNKGYAFYCYTGILNKTFGTQTRFAIDSKELSIYGSYNPKAFINSAAYHIKDCQNITSFNYWVVITRGGLVLTNIQNIKMLYQYYFDKDQFENSVNKILSLQVFSYVAENQ